MPRVVVGVSLKMYFGHREALDWFARVAELVRGHPAVASGAVGLFVIPTYPQLIPARRARSPAPRCASARRTSRPKTPAPSPAR